MDQLTKGTISIPEGVYVRELDGESVLLNLNTESYFGLDAVGTRVWQVLTSTQSVAVAYDVLLQEYDVEPARLSSDLSELISSLLRSGLISIADE